MATTSATALPSLLRCLGKTHLGKFQAPVVTTHFENLRPFTVPDRKRYAVVSKATGESPDSSSGSIVKYIKDAWSESDDRIAIFGLGFAGIAAFWPSVNIIGRCIPPSQDAIDSRILRLLVWWFIYRYLLFKPDREELAVNVKKSLSNVVGK